MMQQIRQHRMAVFSILIIVSMTMQGMVKAADYDQSEDFGIVKPGDVVGFTVTPPGKVLTGHVVNPGGFIWVGGGPASFGGTVPDNYAGVHNGLFRGTWTPGGTTPGDPLTWEVTTEAEGPKSVSVKIEKDDVCAGAVDSDVHRSRVIIEVEPPDSYDSLVVTLSGGVGYDDGVVSEDAPANWGKIMYGGGREGARLIIGGASLTGNTESQKATISTDASGKAEGWIVSSNLIDDSASVSAAIGSVSGADSISFGEPSVTVVLPEMLSEDFEVKTVLKYGNSPVDGHEVRDCVSLVSRPLKVAGITIAWLPVKPVTDWKDYVKDLQFEGGTTNGQGIAAASTGLLFPEDYRGVHVTYSCYDMTAFKEKSAAMSLLESFRNWWFKKRNNEE